MVRTISVAIGIAVIIWTLVVVTNSPRTHAQSIDLLLRQHNIEVSDITVTQQWPNALPFYAYGKDAMPYQATVAVLLPTQRTVKGFLVCQSAPYQCTVTIHDMQLISVPLVDIAESIDVWAIVNDYVRKLIKI